MSMSSHSYYSKSAPRGTASKGVSAVLDESVERAMYEEILGPLVSRGAASYHSYLAASAAAAATRGGSAAASSKASSSFPSDGVYDTLPPVDMCSSPVSRPATSPAKASSGSRGQHNNPLILSRTAQQQPSSTSSTDFTTSLLNRVSTLEAEAQSLRRMLAEKLRAVEDLEKENTALRLVSGRSLSGASAMQRLQRELDDATGDNEYLRSQIADMTQFLSDYGLAWVGKDRDMEEGAGTREGKVGGEVSIIANTAHQSTAHEAKSSDGVTHKVSFATFSSKVNELNSLIRLEPACVRTEYTGAGSRARLVQAHENVETVKVVYYKNGLLVKRGPFRSADSKSYKTFVDDILDGYFPSEYKDEYPDGVIFDLLDKHWYEYEPGCGDEVEGRMTASQLSQRLPKTVLRNGEIINVRKDMDTRLELHTGTAATPAGKHGAVVIDSPAGMLENGAAAGAIVALIQIKWTNGTTFTMKMFYGDVIGDIRELLRRHLQAAGLRDPAFELRTSYPSRTLEDSATVEEAGLVPNGTLHARPVK